MFRQEKITWTKSGKKFSAKITWKIQVNHLNTGLGE